MLLLSLGLLYHYFEAPETQFAAPRQGFSELIDQHITTDSVILSFDPEQPPQVWLSGGWEVPSVYPRPDKFYLGFVLPFRVLTVVVSTYTEPSNWTAVNDNVSVASFVFAEFSNKTVTDYSRYTGGFFQTGFIIDTTFRASKRGINTLVLPLELGVGGEYFPALQSYEEKLRIGIQTPPLQVYVALPANYTSIQAFPEPTSSTPHAGYADNKTLYSIHWDFGQNRRTITYVDSTTQSWYELSVLVGGLAVGVSASGLLDMMEEFSKRSRDAAFRDDE
jgi:hypothetical protein